MTEYACSNLECGFVFEFRHCTRLAQRQPNYCPNCGEEFRNDPTHYTDAQLADASVRDQIKYERERKDASGILDNWEPAPQWAHKAKAADLTRWAHNAD